ncbi:multidrug effflux MFS transporter [Psittacicella gerlachiana]|uniref:Bcr/CflA family efflux transporter n=1 Tax=Psittacicella gerlachiana TaxID=2028574 RepID=A0A3A1YID3_9GAMM|nr:multidrug effflux MFS transporter [Psittacicella gerlachiana]RIY36800.1 hypothetical protein CKF59_02230 [Psittacicella gerlachiana]
MEESKAKPQASASQPKVEARGENTTSPQTYQVESEQDYAQHHLLPPEHTQVDPEQVLAHVEEVQHAGVHPDSATALTLLGQGLYQREGVLPKLPETESESPLTSDASATASLTIPPKLSLSFKAQKIAYVPVWMLGILGMFMWFTSLSTDMYLSAFPQMQHEFQADVEYTLTAFLIGFACGQLFWGPVADRLGRKIPLLIGMALYTLGSYGCAASTSLEQMIVWRLVQALGACTGPMLARAIVRDVYNKTDAAKVMSLLIFLMAAAPLLGPLIGAWVLKFYSWQAIFYIQTGFSLFITFCVLIIPETRPVEYIANARFKLVLKNYWRLITDWNFMRYCLSIFFYYIGIYAFVTGSSWLYISYYQLASEDYGLIFALNNVGVIVFSLLNRRFVAKYQVNHILTMATIVVLISSTWFMFNAGTGFLGIWGVIIPCMLFFAMNGLIPATGTALALDQVPQIAGSAAALLGFLQYSSGIVTSYLYAQVAPGGSGGPGVMASFMLVGAIFSFLCATSFSQVGRVLRVTRISYARKHRK